MSERRELVIRPSDGEKKTEKDSAGKGKEKENEEAKSKPNISEEQSYDQSPPHPSYAASQYEHGESSKKGNQDSEEEEEEEDDGDDDEEEEEEEDDDDDDDDDDDEEEEEEEDDDHDEDDDDDDGHIQKADVIDDVPDLEPPQSIDSSEEASLELQPGDASADGELGFNLYDQEQEAANILVLATAAEYIRDFEIGNEEEDAHQLEKKDLFLFEIPLKDHNILSIPLQTADEYFISQANPRTQLNLLLTNAKAQLVWETTFVYNPEERTFFTTSIEWAEICNHHKLKDSDVILFYRPYPCLSPQHHLIEFDRREECEPHEPVFRMENLLFQLELDKNARISIPRVVVFTCLPEVRIAPGAQKKVTVKFTDGQGKNWYMDIRRENVDFYVIVKGWEEFVQKHELGAKDLIRFYKPVSPSHRKHFLFKIEKN